MKRTLVRGRMDGILCVVPLLAMTLSACGSSGGAADASAGQITSKSVTALSRANALAAQLPDRIATTGKLVVGINSPGSGYNESTVGNKLVGLDPDLITAIAKKLGLTAEIKPSGFDGLIGGIQAGRYDVTLGGMADTKARQKVVSFVDYLKVGIGVLATKGNPKHIQGIDDLCGRTVGTAKGGYPQTTLIPKLSAECTKAGKPAIQPMALAAGSTLVALEAGKIDCSMGDAATNVYAVNTQPGKFTQVGTASTLALEGIGFAKNETQLGTAIQGALQELIKSGEYETIVKRWHLGDQMISEATINKALI